MRSPANAVSSTSGTRYPGVVIPEFVRRSLVLGSLVLGSACGPLVILEGGSESDDESAGETEVSSTTAATSSTTTPPDPTTVSTTTPPDPTGDREPGYCGQTCRSVADCASWGGSRADWACTDGFCEWIGDTTPPPCDEIVCPSAAGLACASVDGWETCVLLCTEYGSECAFVIGSECIGVTDDGSLYCQPPPLCDAKADGEPCESSGVGQFGVCLEGACVCTDDTQCTAEGFACNR